MARRVSMNISVTPQQHKKIQSRVKAGGFQSASEVVRAALLALDERERTEREWRKMIAVGLAQAKRGQFVDGEEFFAELERLDERPTRRKSA